MCLCLYSLNQEECGQDEVDGMEEAGEISHCSIVSMSESKTYFSPLL